MAISCKDLRNDPFCVVEYSASRLQRSSFESGNLRVTDLALLEFWVWTGGRILRFLRREEDDMGALYENNQN